MQWQSTHKGDPSLDQIVEAWDQTLFVARVTQRWNCREDEGDCNHEDCEQEQVWQYYIPGGNEVFESKWLDWEALENDEGYPPFWRELVLPPGQRIQ